MNKILIDIVYFSALYAVLVYWIPILSMAPFESMEIIHPSIKENKYLMWQRNKVDRRIRRLRWIPVLNIYLYIVAVIVCFRYIRSIWVLKKFNQRTK